MKSSIEVRVLFVWIACLLFHADNGAASTADTLVYFADQMFPDGSDQPGNGTQKMAFGRGPKLAPGTLDERIAYAKNPFSLCLSDDYVDPEGCGGCSTCNFLKLTDATFSALRSVSRGYNSFYTTKVNIGYGFETSFTYVFEADISSNSSAMMGTGFAFAVQGFGVNPSSGLTGEALGLNFPNVIALVTLFDNTNRAASITSPPQINMMFSKQTAGSSYALQTASQPASVWYTPGDRYKRHDYTITYDTLPAGGPVLSVYGGGQLVYQLAIDLATYAITTPNYDATTQNVFVGFGAGSISDAMLNQYIRNWNFRAFGDDNLFISCPAGNFSLWINGVQQTVTQLSPFSAFSLQKSWNPDDVIAFSASPSGSSGCLVELRVNRPNTINTIGRWKCSNSFSSDFAAPSFDDSAWPVANIRGGNSLSLGPDPRHVPNVGADAERIWASNVAQTAYCRLELPRFCTPTFMAYCIFNETCSTSGECICEPPFEGESCDTIAPPSVTSISPVDGSNLGGTRIQVNGESLGNSDVCSFDGIQRPDRTVWKSFTLIECLSLPASAGQTQVSVRIERGSQQTASFTFTYTEPLVIKTVDPHEISTNGGVLITITGENFPVHETVKCRFTRLSDSAVIADDIEAIVSNANLLVCYSPKASPTVAEVSVSRNGADWFYWNSTVVFYDIASPYCRDYREDEGTKGTEFDFVSLDQQLGLPHYPTNVAQGQQVTASNSNNAVYFEGDEVVNEDFCCSLTDLNSGRKCGAIFETTTSFVNITLQLRYRAKVNELITSWYNPCVNMPKLYNLYAVVDGVRTLLISRSTVGNSSCSSAPGDNGEIGLCLNYFNPVEASKFFLEYSNTVSNLPDQSNSSWLYEMAIQGHYLDIPTAFKLSSTNPVMPPLTAALSTSFSSSLGNFIEFLDVDNNTIPSVFGTYKFQLRLFRVINGTPTDVTSLLSGNTTQNYPSAGFFSDVRILSPPVGDYELRFSSPDIAGEVRVPFQIIAGSAYQLFCVQSSSEALSALVINVDPITVCVRDEAGNDVLFSGVVQVVSTLVLNGTVSVTFNAQTCGTFDEIVVESPKTLTKTSFKFVAGGLLPATLPFSITFGTSHSITFQTLPSESTESGGVVLLNQPIVQVRDINGNLVGEQAGTATNRHITVTARVVNSTGVMDPVSVEVFRGQAVFSSLALRGIIGEYYRLIFTVSDNAAVNVTSPPIYIVPCPADAHVVPSEDQTTCECEVGHESKNGTCSPCDLGFYKDWAGNDMCEACDEVKTTYAKGESQCLCKPGQWTSLPIARDSACHACPEGGDCDTGYIVGTKDGYWRPAELPLLPNGDVNYAAITFYPCHDSEYPSTKDLEAALEACPAQRSLSPVCAGGYQSTRCLQCDGGFGHNGPFCEECPPDAQNWGIFTLCGLVILAFLVFMIYQGRGPKNKESVSARILLNHIQMLALLSAVGGVWADPFQTLLLIGGATSFVDTEVTSTDCAFSLSYYYEFLFFIAIPWVTVFGMALIFLGVFLVQVAVPRIKRSDIRPDYKKLRSEAFSHYVLSVTVIIFLIYPGICVKVLEMFDCSVEVDGVRYLTASPDLPCDSSDYHFWVIFAYVMLFLFCVGVPLLAFILLYKFRGSANPHVQMVVRFFYDGYKPQYYYWEIAVVIRKFLLVVIIIVADGAVYQIYAFIFVVQAALLAHAIGKPYTSGRQFHLELWSLVVILITIGASLFIPTLKSSSDGAALAISWVLFLLNVFVVLAFVFYIGRGLARRFIPGVWGKAVACWNATTRRKSNKDKSDDFRTAMDFFRLLGDANDEERRLLYENMEIWWKTVPNYKRRRMMQHFAILAKGTAFSNFAGAKIKVRALTESARVSMEMSRSTLQRSQSQESSKSEDPSGFYKEVTLP